MAANEEEIGLMKAKRYRYLLLFSSLLLILTGCSRRDVLDNYPVSGVQITLDWEGITGQLPDGVRVIFYPKDAGGKKFDERLPIRGGSVNVIPGRYSVVIYNWNTETIKIRSEESFETIEAYTDNCTGLGIAGTEKMVWEPDPLYVVSVEDVKIEKSDEVLQLEYKPKLVVKSYSFEMKVTGLQYVRNVAGFIDGMAGCYHLGTGEKSFEGSQIYFDIEKTAEGISGSFHVFGVPDVVTRAGSVVTLTLAFVKVDNSMQSQAIDITEAIKSSESGGTQPGEEVPEFTLPLEDPAIEVEKPTSPPVDGGGFEGDVDDWGKEDEVILPVN